MAAFPAAALIQAGGQLLGGLFNKPKTISPAKQIKSTVAGARAAGIHPLAALGASPGYTQVGSSNAGSAIGGALDRFGAALANEKSQAELDALAASTDAQRAQADLYRAQSRTLISRAGNAARGGPPVDDQPVPLTMFGAPVTRDASKFSSAQRVQDEFGDIAEQFVGLPSLFWSATEKPRKWLDNNVPTDRQIYDWAKKYFKNYQRPKRTR